jgi:PAS domain S-box-containing protein
MSSLRFRLFLLVLLAVVPAEADQTLAFNLSGLGVVAGLAILAAWVGSDVFVLRRLKVLVRATQQLAEGDLSVRTHFPQEWGELSQLSFAFDTMAASLQDLLKQRDLAEEALQRAGVELEIRVEERTAELARANALLQEQIVRVQRAEEMLQETSRFQTAILESANYTIISISVDGTILTFNAAAQAWLGYTAHEVVGKTTPILFHDHDEVVQRAQQLSAEMGVQIEPGFEVFVAKARRGEPDEQEWTYIRKDGTRFPVLLSVTRLMNAEGEITGFLGIGSDLTERKRAEEALQKYTNELHDLYNNASCGYHSLDKDGTFLRINDTELNWLGYTRNEIVGKMKFFELLTAESLKTFSENFSQFKERGSVRDLEFQMVCKNGTILPVLLNSTAIKDASGSYVMSRSTIFEITERKRAEEQIRTLNAQLEQRVIERTAQLEVANALKDELLVREQLARELAEASEQRYRALADAMPQIVWTANPEGWLDYYNQRWFDYTGMTLEQTQGWGWQPVLHPDDLQKCIDCWNQAVATGESYEIEYRFKRASDGQYRWHLGRAVPMRDARGAIIKWFGIATDINDRKLAEQERERLLEQLKRDREDLAALSTVTANAISTLNLEDLLDVLLKRVVEVTQADTAVILLKENDYLRPRASIGIDQEASSRFTIPISQGFAGTIAAAMQPLYIEDAQTDPRIVNPLIKQKGIRTMLGVPLKRHGSLVGVLHVGWCSIHQESDRELHLLEITAERCTMAILNAQLYEQTKQLQERLQLQIERMPIGCIVSDKQSLVTDWNPAAEKIFGYTKEEVLGKEPCQLITPPAVRPHVEEIFRQLTAGEMTVHSVNENMTKDGRTIICEWFNTPLKEADGTVVGMLSMAQDITERKGREQELRRKDELYRTLARNFPNGAVFLFDQDLRYTLAEGTGITGFGLSSQSFEGKTIWEALEPDMSEMLEPVYRQALAGTPSTFEAPYKDKVYLVQVLPVTNSSGGNLCRNAVYTDITERKQTEPLWRYAFYEPLTGLA